MRKGITLLLVMLAMLVLAACGGEPEVLRLATTTSTADSGLLRFRGSQQCPRRRGGRRHGAGY